MRKVLIAGIAIAALLVPGTAPGAARVDLSQFKLQYATSTTAHEVYPIGGFNRSPYFTQTSNYVQLRVYANGEPTSGAEYARCELREMRNGEKASWSTTTGTHVMNLTARVTHVPGSRPRVVVAQIHGTAQDFIIVMYDATQRALTWKLNSASQGTLATGVDLGESFTLTLSVSYGTISISVNGSTRATTVAPNTTAYFKAGAYLQTYEGSDYGEVRISSLSVRHG